SGFDKLTDVSQCNLNTVVTLELKAGEFVLFNEQTVHRSFENVTDQTRVALVARFTSCAVNLHQEQFPFFKGHGAILVSGSDQFGFNRLVNPPPGEDIPLREHTTFASAAVSKSSLPGEPGRRNKRAFLRTVFTRRL